jgi:protein-tyrosine phosphatase
MAQTVTLHMADRADVGRELRVDAAGTHVGRAGVRPDARGQALLAKRGYAASKNRSRQIVSKDFEKYDLILALDRANLKCLQQLCPAEHQHKIRLFMEFSRGVEASEVPDPYYGNAQGFEHVLTLCEAGALGLIAHYQSAMRSTQAL